MVRCLFSLFFPLPNIISISTLCSAEITFKTDPKNTDYIAEHGASRNFEPWREEQAADDEDKLAKLEAEENNPMKALENRTKDSKREMDILDALQDIRARNARNERLGKTVVDLAERAGQDDIEDDEEKERKRLEEEDEQLVRQVFSKIEMPEASSSSSDSPGSTTITVKRKADTEEPSIQSLLPDSARTLISSKAALLHPAKKPKVQGKNSLGIKLVKKAKPKTAVS